MDNLQHNTAEIRLMSLYSIERDLFFYLGALEQLHIWWTDAAIYQMNRFSTKPSFLDIINTLETAGHSIRNLCGM